MSKKITIVIADDHAVVRSGIRQFIEKEDDFVVLADVVDGEAAVKVIQELSPDVAILDIQMPKMSGIEVTKWVKENDINTGILILTAYDDPPFVTAVLKAGANGFILKTANPEAIISAVRDVNEGRSVIDSTLAEKIIVGLGGDNNENIYESLTDRETEVLGLTALGYTNKSIAVQLGISGRTVQGHLSNIFDKLRASSRTQAVMRAVSLGWINSKI